VLILTKAIPAALGYPNVAKKGLRAGLTESLSAAPLVAGAVYAGLKKYNDRRTAVAQTDSGAAKK